MLLCLLRYYAVFTSLCAPLGHLAPRALLRWLPLYPSYRSVPFPTRVVLLLMLTVCVHALPVLPFSPLCLGSKPS